MPKRGYLHDHYMNEERGQMEEWQKRKNLWENFSLFFMTSNYGMTDFICEIVIMIIDFVLSFISKNSKQLNL